MQNELAETEVNLGFLKHQIDIKIASILSFLRTPSSNSNISRRIQTEPSDMYKDDKQSTIVTHDYYNATLPQANSLLPIDDFYVIDNASHITSNKSLGPIYTQRTRNPTKYNTNYKLQHQRAGSTSLNQQDITKIYAKPPVSNKNPQFQQTIRKRKQQLNVKLVKREPVQSLMLQHLSTQITKGYAKQRKQTNESYKTRTKFIQRVAKMGQKQKKI